MMSSVVRIQNKSDLYIIEFVSYYSKALCNKTMVIKYFLILTKTELSDTSWKAADTKEEKKSGVWRMNLGVPQSEGRRGSVVWWDSIGYFVVL